MEKLNKNVMKAIKESLPEATAGVLKEYFDDHENLVNEFEDLNEQYDSAQATIRTLRSKLEKLKDYEGRLSEIEVNETNLADEKAEFNIQQRVLEVEQHHNHHTISEYKEMFNKVFDTVFRNTEIRKSITKSHVVKNPGIHNGSYDNNGQPIMQDNGECVEDHTDTELTEEK